MAQFNTYRDAFPNARLTGTREAFMDAISTRQWAPGSRLIQTGGI